MKAILLAAGRGTRISRYLDGNPKCTVDLANGTKSIYLDTYKSGKRSYEFLKLYLLPEDDDKAKAVNAETLQKAEAVKNQRVQEILSGKYKRTLYSNIWKYNSRK